MALKERKVDVNKTTKNVNVDEELWNGKFAEEEVGTSTKVIVRDFFQHGLLDLIYDKMRNTPGTPAEIASKVKDGKVKFVFLNKTGFDNIDKNRMYHKYEKSTHINMFVNMEDGLAVFYCSVLPFLEDYDLRSWVTNLKAFDQEKAEETKKKAREAAEAGVAKAALRKKLKEHADTVGIGDTPILFLSVSRILNISDALAREYNIEGTRVLLCKKGLIFYPSLRKLDKDDYPRAVYNISEAVKGNSGRFKKYYEPGAFEDYDLATIDGTYGYAIRHFNGAMPWDTFLKSEARFEGITKTNKQYIEEYPAILEEKRKNVFKEAAEKTLSNKLKEKAVSIGIGDKSILLLSVSDILAIPSYEASRDYDDIKYTSVVSCAKGLIFYPSLRDFGKNDYQKAVFNISKATEGRLGRFTKYYVAGEFKDEDLAAIDRAYTFVKNNYGSAMSWKTFLEKNTDFRGRPTNQQLIEEYAKKLETAK